MYQFFKKYQDEHEKKFPSKGDALLKRWDAFKAAEEAAALERSKPKEESKDEPKVVELKTDVEPERAPVEAPKPKKELKSEQPKKDIPVAPKVEVDKNISTYNGA